jgi:hypothetical protein
LERAKESLVPESKDTVADSVGLTSEHLPSSEAKTDSETALLFQFPVEDSTSATGKSAQSPLHPPARMSSSSSDEASTEVKHEHLEGQRNPHYDPNDEEIFAMVC